MAVRTLVKMASLKDYMLLTKPGIFLLVLITALTGMYFAQRGMPPAGLVFLDFAWHRLGFCGLCSSEPIL